MAIVKTVSFYDFERAFVDAGRGDNFSYEGKKILFDYLENLSKDIREPIELDVIAFCCEYSELSDIDLIREYECLGIDEEELLQGVYVLEDIIDRLDEYTYVCGSYYCEENEKDFIVFQSF